MLKGRLNQIFVGLMSSPWLDIGSRLVFPVCLLPLPVVRLQRSTVRSDATVCYAPCRSYQLLTENTAVMWWLGLTPLTRPAAFDLPWAGLREVDSGSLSGAVEANATYPSEGDFGKRCSAAVPSRTQAGYQRCKK